MRRIATDAETALWLHLRNRQLCGHKFVRQEPVGPYVADFACRAAKLVIEVDGGQHAESDADLRRDASLRSRGYTVLRFWNADVLESVEGALTVILRALGDLRPGPATGPAPHPDRPKRADPTSPRTAGRG